MVAGVRVSVTYRNSRERENRCGLRVSMAAEGFL
jgi:hypothetical protein